MPQSLVFCFAKSNSYLFIYFSETFLKISYVASTVLDLVVGERIKFSKEELDINPAFVELTI